MFLDLPEKDRIALLEAELMKARKEMKMLNKVILFFHNLCKILRIRNFLVIFNCLLKESKIK